MVNIDELFQMDGVVAVGKIDDMGRIVDWKAKGVVSPEVKDATSKVVSELLSISNGIGRTAPRNWLPWHTWIYYGGEMIMVVHGDSAVTFEAAKTDMNKVLEKMGMLIRVK
jgi:roadblock/LC7 domain-containing protein